MAELRWRRGAENHDHRRIESRITLEPLAALRTAQALTLDKRKSLRALSLLGFSFRLFCPPALPLCQLTDQFPGHKNGTWSMSSGNL